MALAHSILVSIILFNCMPLLPCTCQHADGSVWPRAIADFIAPFLTVRPKKTNASAVTTQTAIFCERILSGRV
ncbi:hypothetical protein BX661DRAFT_184799 [Kickxella alabastrina]|uniref:uncharacterized protein n=1 Tax=Kickxella alabastrina TaxID=61397 RepID=UPI00221F5905|nr:uncharacterized protein BX661DRAFT_184799 [Kickxella alabastrina]KAI7825545.1 hypothetical protein BX661DRAFT_184799 [Kickxella alabastrina]